MKPKRTERQEIRLSTEEKAFIEKAAKKKGMSISEFIRSTSVEMAQAISLNKTAKETYYAVLMGVGKVAPEVSMYAATADMSEYTSMSGRKEENDEGKNET